MDDLGAAFTRDTSYCANTDVSTWRSDIGTSLTIVKTGGVVSGVQVNGPMKNDPSFVAMAPSTARGVGIGSSLTELKQAYPDITRIGGYGTEGSLQQVGGAFDDWSITSGNEHISFELGVDGILVNSIWVSTTPLPGAEFCA